MATADRQIWPAREVAPSRRLELARLRRILVARTDNRGDLLMAGPAIRAIAAAAPRAELTLLVSPGGAEAAALLPWQHRTWTERVVWQDAGPEPVVDAFRERAFLRRLAHGRYDAAFILTSFSQTPYPLAYAACLAGIPVRVGFAALFGGGVLTHPVAPPPVATNQTDRNLALIEGVGVPAGDRRLEVRIPRHAHSRAVRLLREIGIAAGVPYLVAAPFASCDARTYPAKAFASALRLTVRQTGWPAVIISSERERERAGRLGRSVPGARSLAGRTTFAGAAAIIEGARLLLGSHSGPMHVAAATGTPAVIAFSGTDMAEQWVRPMDGVAAVTRPVPCAPCGRFTCPIGKPCLEIPPAEMAARAAELLMDSREGTPWIATAS